MVHLPSLPIKGETRRRLGEQDRRWKFKLGLRAFATFLAFIAFLLFAVATGITREDYVGSDWTDAMALAPTLLALIYNPIHIAYSLSLHSTPHPIHPAYPLTFDTLIWSLGVPATYFSIDDGWFWYWEPVTFEFRNLATGDVLVPCSGSNLRSKVCSPMIYTLGRVELAANVFLCLLILAQFTLFVYSCVAAHRHRIARRQARRSRGVVGGDADTELAVSPRSSDPSRFAGHLAKAPPAYTVSAVGGQHAGSPHPIAPSFVRSDVVSGDGTAKERAEGSGFPSPSLGPPVSPVNSGSGGGFGDSHHHSWGRNSGHGAQGPFGDENAIKYQGR